jgi:glutathione S-transferase
LADVNARRRRCQSDASWSSLWPFEPHVAGANLSLADIGVVSNLINYQYLEFGIDRADYPKLAKYADGILALNPFRKALQAEAPVAEQMGLDRKFLA